MMRYISRGYTRCQFAIQKKLFVYDAGIRNGSQDYSLKERHSGIRATIFGASGTLGLPICAQLGLAHSDMVIPLNTEHHFKHSEQMRQLKTTGSNRRMWFDLDMDFKDYSQIQKMVRNSNVVINLLGPRAKLKKKQDFEWINVEVAEKIAHACNKHGVHRLIHFSAAGASPDSPSLDFQTKYQGQAAVKKIFPNVTILRPCPVYSMNDNFASLIRGQLNFFWNKFVIVYDDCQAKKQPIRQNDVAKCVLNALKLEQTKGKTYQLGGPNVLSMLQIHEIMFNIMKLRPKIAYVDPAPAQFIGKYIYNWPYFNLEMLRKRRVEEVVKSDQYGTIADLLVQPVSFKSGIFDCLRDYIAYYRDIDEDYDN